MARWVLNPVALVKAAKKLGVKEPVSVRTFKDDYWSGQHDPFPLHILWINKDVKMHEFYDPTWTIWHELAHALQCERDFGGDGVKMEEVMDRDYAHIVTKYGNPRRMPEAVWYRTYNAIPWEKEANEVAAKYAPNNPLVRITS